MNREIQQRLQWVRLYEDTGNAGLVCRRCGISRPTLRKWWNRYKQQGEGGLESLSRRPHRSPNTKVGKQEERLILKLRKTRNLGARRIQSELFFLYSDQGRELVHLRVDHPARLLVHGVASQYQVAAQAVGEFLHGGSYQGDAPAISGDGINIAIDFYRGSQDSRPGSVGYGGGKR